MTPVSPETLVIGGDKRKLRVRIDDTWYVLQPMSVPQIERFISEGGAGLTAALSGAFAGESGSVEWAPLIVEHGPRLRVALHVASGVPLPVIEGLDPAELIQFTDVVMGLNLDFFVQRVRPALGHLVGTMTRIAQRASPRSSPTASRH